MGRILLDDPAHAGGSDQLLIGTVPNDGTGDQPRIAGTKLKQWAADINSMTTDLYAPQQPQTAAELAASITPTITSLTAGTVGLATRYNADPTGTADSTSALQTWINAAWSMYNYTDGQGLWNGGGAADPISVLPPGKYKLSGSFVVGTGMTVRAVAEPSHTTNHTRLVMNSTGVTTARTWTAATWMPTGANVQATASGTLYNFRNNGSQGGTTAGSAPAWPTSGTVTDGGVTWTNVGACTAGDNRNTPIMKLSRANHLGGGTLMNQNFCSTIQWLEFWSVSLGGSFSNPYSAASTAYLDYPLGGGIFIDCDIVDTRLAQCVFQNMMAPSINIQNVVSGHTASDGFTNAGNIDLYIDDCEFDACPMHLYALNSTLSLTFKNCEFFGGLHLYVNCTGKVTYDNCRFYGGAHVDASATSNSFTVFTMKNCKIEMTSNGDTTNSNVSVYGAALVDISNNTVYLASTIGAFFLRQCNAGRVGNNTINDAGFNSVSTTGLGAIAAIKMVDCTNIGVLDNTISATDTGSPYNGFGILTLGSGRGSSGNFINGNLISAPYNGATYNGQGRRLNVATSADIVGTNYDPNGWLIAKQAAIAWTRVGIPYSTTVTIDASTGNIFEIVANNGTAFTVANPTNLSEGQPFILVIINSTGGSLGTISFGTVYKFTTIPSPNAGGSTAIYAYYNGTHIVELVNGPGTVPN